jgi:hypothetical protein
LMTTALVPHSTASRAFLQKIVDSIPKEQNTRCVCASVYMYTCVCLCTRVYACAHACVHVCASKCCMCVQANAAFVCKQMQSTVSREFSSPAVAHSPALSSVYDV